MENEAMANSGFVVRHMIPNKSDYRFSLRVFGDL